MNDQRLLLGAIRGPVTMIVIGILFLIDHLDYYSFRQTWPVLLIVMGLLTLGARAGWSRDAGQRGAGPESGSGNPSGGVS